MNRYLFLCAWADGSDGAGGDDTRVECPEDLYSEYITGSEHIFALVVVTDKSINARMCGQSRAFEENYTEYDTVSDVILLDSEYKALPETMVVRL